MTPVHHARAHRGGDVAVWFGELDEPQTEDQLLARALDPEPVWATGHRAVRSRRARSADGWRTWTGDGC